MRSYGGWALEFSFSLRKVSWGHFLFVMTAIRLVSLKIVIHYLYFPDFTRFSKDGACVLLYVFYYIYIKRFFNLPGIYPLRSKRYESSKEVS